MTNFWSFVFRHLNFICIFVAKEDPDHRERIRTMTQTQYLLLAENEHKLPIHTTQCLTHKYHRLTK